MISLALIRTAPEHPPGSMTAYAQMVQQSLSLAEGAGFRVKCIDFFDAAPQRSMWQQHVWRLLHRHQVFAGPPPDLYHLLDGSMAAFLPSRVLPRTVATVHDLIPLLQRLGRLPGRPSLPAALLVRHAITALKRCQGLAADSHQTRRDVTEWIGRADVPVIPLAVRPFLPSASDARASTPAEFILHVGNNALYKNRQGVLRVFARLRDLPELALVMVGPEPPPALRREAEAIGNVQFAVDAGDSVLRALYERARVLLFPSLYEGFGMPVLEAMAAGCPVVCSSAGALPEVAGGAALAAPPDDVEQLAQHCRSLLRDGPARGAAVDRGKVHAATYSFERLSRNLRAWYSAVCPA